MPKEGSKNAEMVERRDIPRYVDTKTVHNNKKKKLRRPQRIGKKMPNQVSLVSHVFFFAKSKKKKKTAKPPAVSPFHDQESKWPSFIVLSPAIVFPPANST